MKKLITMLVLTASLESSSQVDTMIIREPITFQLQDLAWLRGKLGATQDSAVMRSDRNINAKVRALPNPTWATNVSVDGLPGRLVIIFYNIAKRNGSEFASRYSAIVSALRGVTQLATYFDNIDDAIDREKDAAITIGKYIYVDY